MVPTYEPTFHFCHLKVASAENARRATLQESGHLTVHEDYCASDHRDPAVYATRRASAFGYRLRLGLLVFRGRQARRMRELVEHFALHALDFSSVPAGYEAQLLGTAALAQAGQEVQQVGNALARDFQLLIVLKHGRISTTPRRRRRASICVSVWSCGPRPEVSPGVGRARPGEASRC